MVAAQGHRQVYRGARRRPTFAEIVPEGGLQLHAVQHHQLLGCRAVDGRRAVWQ